MTAAVGPEVYNALITYCQPLSLSRTSQGFSASHVAIFNQVGLLRECWCSAGVQSLQDMVAVATVASTW